MKTSIKSIVKSIIKDNMKQLGFKSYSNLFYRQIHGVIQGFKIYSNNMHYTIRFGCYPLCGGMTRDLVSFENHEIAHLLPSYRDEFIYAIPWGELRTEEEMNEAWLNRKNKYTEIASQLVNELNSYLLPQLLEISSLQEALDFEKKCHTARIRYWNNNITAQEDEKLYNQHDAIYLWNWHLQMRNYEEAKLCLHKWIEELKEYSRQNNIECDNSFLEIPYNYLVEENYDAIEKYIEEKENITLKSFSLKRQ